MSRDTDAFAARAQKRMEEHLPFDVESWYPILHAVTFETEFIEFSPAAAKATVAFYQTRFNSKVGFNHTDAEIIRSIGTKIDTTLMKVRHFKSTGAFVRMSSRSPKDGSPFRVPDLKRRYEQALQDIQNEEKSSTHFVSDENRELRALFKASSQSWRVRNADDALNLLLSSERIFVDLLEVLACHEANQVNLKWCTQICLRAWEEDLDDQFEFRCFVAKRVLTAMSQYNHYCAFPMVLNDAERIHSTIRAFCCEVVIPMLASYDAYDNFVLDVGLMGDRCVVIELNPFKPSTGAALFDWKRDKALLNEGIAENEAGYPTCPSDSLQVGTPPLRLRQIDMESIGDLVEWTKAELHVGAPRSGEEQCREMNENYRDAMSRLEGDVEDCSERNQNGLSSCTCQ